MAHAMGRPLSVHVAMEGIRLFFGPPFALIGPDVA